MSEGAVYRTIVVLDCNNFLLYGHSIFWQLSKLDYVTENWKRKRIGSMCVCFKDISESEFEEVLFTRSLTLTIGATSISVPLPTGFEEAFLEQSYDADEYNPFINLCTLVNYYYPEVARYDVDYLKDHKDDFEKVESEFSLAISKFPHLLETFSVFLPTRLEEDFRGIDDARGIGYEIVFSDPFSLYQTADVAVEAMADGIMHNFSYTLDKDRRVVSMGSIPDSVITTVTFAGKIIFKSSFSLVKRINISSNVVSEKRIEHKGEIITQSIIDRRCFDV